jgi:hypothetical protein
VDVELEFASDLVNGEVEFGHGQLPSIADADFHKLALDGALGRAPEAPLDRRDHRLAVGQA